MRRTTQTHRRHIYRDALLGWQRPVSPDARPRGATTVDHLPVRHRDRFTPPSCVPEALAGLPDRPILEAESESPPVRWL